MSAKRLLIATSPGIASRAWFRRNLDTAIGDSKDFEVYMYGKNETLRAELYSKDIDIVHISMSDKVRRTEIRNALENADFILIFWDGRSLNELIFEARLRNIPMKVLPFQVAEIVNREKTEDYDAYIGRGTPWGNPFPVGKQEGQFERDEAIEKFRKHFEDNILGDPSKRRGLLGLKGMRLACHCKPLACHGDVIAAYLNSLDPDQVNGD